MMPQEIDKTAELDDYLTSIDAIESLTLLDFMPGTPREAELEAMTAGSLW